MLITTERLIYDAYRTLGVLRTGQMVSADQTDDAFRALNDLVESWSLESLMVYATLGTTYNLSAGLSAYTLGPGGTLGGTRPTRVESAGIFYASSSSEIPVPVLTLDRYRSGQPGIYIDGSFPVANLTIQPLPQTGQRLILYDWTLVSQFADLSGSYEFPPGYAQCLRWNLALQLAPMARIHTKIPDVLYTHIEQQAIQSKAWVKSFNSAPAPEMDATDGGALGCCWGEAYDVYTDRY